LRTTQDLGRALARQEDKLSACVHCGFCLPTCPTYSRLGDEADSPRGRLHLMKALVEGRIEASAQAYQVHLDRCLGCRACETVCPSGVEYGALLEVAREAAIAARPLSVASRTMLGVFARPVPLRLAMLATALVRWTRIPRLLARALPGRGATGAIRLASAMLASSAQPAPVFAGRSRAEPVPALPERLPAGTAVVGMLEGCVQAGLFKRVNDATRRTLEVNGYRLRSVPEQRCCGALHAHAGHLAAARRLARANIDAFEAAGVNEVVVNAAGCGATLKEYGHLLADDAAYAERSARFARGVKDVSELLAQAGPVQGGTVQLKVAYDAPCHLHHGQGVVEEPIAVLRRIPGLDLVPLARADECCGGAGIYGLTHPELGGRIGGDKVSAVVQSGAEAVATGNPGCMMQIGAGLEIARSPVPVYHPVELLDASYRVAGLY
jgi:glycolate oxidase iron-sulfur subunit